MSFLTPGRAGSYVTRPPLSSIGGLVRGATRAARLAGTTLKVGLAGSKAGGGSRAGSKRAPCATMVVRADSRNCAHVRNKTVEVEGAITLGNERVVGAVVGCRGVRQDTLGFQDRAVACRELLPDRAQVRPALRKGLRPAAHGRVFPFEGFTVRYLRLRSLAKLPRGSPGLLVGFLVLPGGWDRGGVRDHGGGDRCDVCRLAGRVPLGPCGGGPRCRHPRRLPLPRSGRGRRRFLQGDGRRGTGIKDSEAVIHGPGRYMWVGEVTTVAV